jgi:hypothetical protein
MYVTKGRGPRLTAKWKARDLLTCKTVRGKSWHEVWDKITTLHNQNSTLKNKHETPISRATGLRASQHGVKHRQLQERRRIYNFACIITIHLGLKCVTGHYMVIKERSHRHTKAHKEFWTSGYYGLHGDCGQYQSWIQASYFLNILKHNCDCTFRRWALAKSNFTQYAQLHKHQHVAQW